VLISEGRQYNYRGSHLFRRSFKQGRSGHYKP